MERVTIWFWQAWKAIYLRRQNKQQLVGKPRGPRMAASAKLVRESQMLAPDSRPPGCEANGVMAVFCALGVDLNLEEMMASEKAKPNGL